MWVVGAWSHYRVTGDREFLKTAYPVAERLLKEMRTTRYDTRFGLFQGPSFLNDGIAGYPAPPAPADDLGSGFVLDHPGTDRIMALSTNCLYVGAYRALASMAKVAGGSPTVWNTAADRLKAAINRRLWIPKGRTYGYFLDPTGHLDPSQEGAGLAFAALFDVGSPSILRGAHVEPFGVADVWPSFPRYSAERPGRHNAIVWPMVQGMWARAAAKARDVESFRTQDGRAGGTRAARRPLLGDLQRPDRQARRRLSERPRLGIRARSDLVRERVPQHGHGRPLRYALRAERPPLRAARAQRLGRREAFGCAVPRGDPSDRPDGKRFEGGGPARWPLSATGSGRLDRAAHRRDSRVVRMTPSILLAGLEVRLDGVAKAPPSPEDLRALLDYAGAPLPEEYLDAMRRMDGLSGFYGEEDDPIYLVLDSCRSVVEGNEAHHLRERGSSLLAVGGDGGGEAFAIDRSTGEWVMVTWIDIGSGEDEFRFRSLRAMMDAFVAGTAFDG